MNIYIPIEVKARELEGKFLTALVAAERGHHVLIGDKKDTINLAKEGKLPPGIVHDKSVTPGSYKIENFKKLKQNGHLITAQDEEHGLLDVSYEEFAKRRFSEETLSYVSRVYTWGSHDYHELQKKFTGQKKKFMNSGSPRVDLWRPDFKEFYTLKNPEYKPYILISSNFSTLLDENRLYDRIARLRDAGYFDRDPGMEEYMYENSAYQLRLVHRFIEMIRELAGTFPDLNFLVRPHPVESVDAWEKLIGNSDYTNVIVERKGTINGWLHHSELLIHNGCTTALEAVAGNIPAIAYRPIPSSYEREIPNQLSIQASKISEIRELIVSIRKGKNPTNKGFRSDDDPMKLLNNRLCSLQGDLASEKIVNDWEKLANENNLPVSDLTEFKNTGKNIGVPVKRKLKRKLVMVRNKLFGIEAERKSKEYRLLTGHKFPHLHDDEIEEMINNFRKVTGRFDNVNTKRFGEKTFLLFSEN